MLSPKRVRFRKKQKGRRKGLAQKGSSVHFGGFGLQAMGSAWMTNRQIEAGRIAITRRMKRGGKVWIRVFPDKPVSHKPAETRMGKGKGSPDGWVAVIRPGRILYEIDGVEPEVAMAALKLARYKLGFPTRVVTRRR